MKTKFLSLFLALGIFAIGTSVMAIEEKEEARPEKSLTIADKACEILIDNQDNNSCSKLCGSSRSAAAIGECISKITDSTIKAAIKAGLRGACGADTLSICNKVTCKKAFGFGGDTNCKAICCASGNADVLKPCCDAANDKTCCGQQ